MIVSLGTNKGEPTLLDLGSIPALFNDRNTKSSFILSKSDKKRLRALPSDFAPSTTDILFGKEKHYFSHPGRERLRAMIEQNLDRYKNNTRWNQKSRIVNAIYESTKGEEGKYVQFQNGVWYDLCERDCKEKIGHAIRSIISYRAKFRSEMEEEEKKKIDEEEVVSQKVQAVLSRMKKDGRDLTGVSKSKLRELILKQQSIFETMVSDDRKSKAAV